MSRKIMSMFLAPAAKSLLKPSLVSRCTGIFYFQLAKKFSTKQLTPAVALITNGFTKHLKNKPNLSEFSSKGRPLAIILCWLGAQNKAIEKYAQFYTDQDFDVLTIKINPWMIFLPNRTDLLIQNEVLPILLSSNHGKKVIHGFSVGGFVFGGMLKFMHNDPTGKCQELMKTMTAQIWDSVTGVEGIAIGVSESIFTKSPVLQKLMESYYNFYIKACYDFSTYYFDEAHDYLYNKPLRAPALILGSEIDKIATIDVSQAIQKSWKELGIECSQKIWKDTIHVGHMKGYPEEYKMAVMMLLDRSGTLQGLPCQCSDPITDICCANNNELNTIKRHNI